MDVNDADRGQGSRHPFLRIAGFVLGGKPADAMPLTKVERRRLVPHALVLWIGVLAVVAAGAVWLALGMRSPAIVVSSSTGVSIIRGNRQIPAAENLRLKADDLLQVPPGGMIVFRYRDGTRVESGSRVELIFEPRLVARSGGAKNISVQRGQARITVSQQVQGKQFSVVTPQRRRPAKHVSPFPPRQSSAASTWSPAVSR